MNLFSFQSLKAIVGVVGLGSLKSSGHHICHQFDLNLQFQRGLSTSSALFGKRNFRKFHLGNKRGTRLFRKHRREGRFPDLPIESKCTKK